MNDYLTNRHDMHKTVLGVLDAHADAWAHVPAMQGYRDALAARIQEFRDAAKAQTQTSKPATAAKKALRKKVADRSWRLGKAIAAWARANDRPDVAEAVTMPSRDFGALRDTQLAEYSEIVVGEAREHLPADGEDPTTGLGTHGVTAEYVDALDALDDEFAQDISTPRQATIARKEAGRTAARVVNQTQKFLREQVDATVEFLDPDAPTFAAAYRDARIIVDRGRGPSAPDDTPDGDPA